MFNGKFGLKHIQFIILIEIEKKIGTLIGLYSIKTKF